MSSFPIMAMLRYHSRGTKRHSDFLPLKRSVDVRKVDERKGPVSQAKETGPGTTRGIVGLTCSNLQSLFELLHLCPSLPVLNKV